MTQLPPTVEARLQALPTGLRDHIERARGIARDLARRHGVDEALADLATATHDLARALGDEALLAEARRYRLRILHVERHTPVLLHGPVAARWLQHEHGVADKRVLEAVRWHTTGRTGMGPVAKVVLLADKLDPEKVARYPYLESIRVMASQSLDTALLELVNRDLDYFVRTGVLIHPASVGLRNELIVALR